MTALLLQTCFITANHGKLLQCNIEIFCKFTVGVSAKSCMVFLLLPQVVFLKLIAKLPLNSPSFYATAESIGSIAPLKSSNGDQNWFPTNHKAKYLMKYLYVMHNYIFFTFCTVQRSKLECNLCNGDKLLSEIFLAIQLAEDFHSQQNFSMTVLHYGSDKGSLIRFFTVPAYLMMK